MKETHYPPGCGADIDVPLLHNPYQAAFQTARRQRYCLHCKTTGETNGQGEFVCSGCGVVHVSNLTAPRLYDRLLVLAGRGGGKTLIGAHAVREEALIPNSIIWVMGPTYKILHDSTFPTLIRLIPKEWVKKWDAEHMEVTLINGTIIAFRSLEDPERARGPHGVTCGWFDEAAQCPERAYDVFEPTLIKAGGIVICTTTVLGFDWTYEKIEKRATIEQEPGFWAVKYWTEENPLFQVNPVMKAAIERARKTKSPEFFAEEYRAERRNATGNIYDYQLIEKQTLLTDDEIRRKLPEWPAINPSRQILIGLDYGADHPFGATMTVVTEYGLVVIAEYLERMKALSLQLDAIRESFKLHRFPNITWAANKNEVGLRLEFGLRGVGVVQAENSQHMGIQRVQSWLYSGQMFLAHTCPKTIAQLREYRYATNYAIDGQKKNIEQVFKKNDELPDTLRYAMMAWPELPAIAASVDPVRAARMASYDQKTILDIQRMLEAEKHDTRHELREGSEGWPTGDFFTTIDNEY